jgi:hypothetical protein
MSHLVQTTYNDVELEDKQVKAIFAAGAFVRFDTDTQVTVCCTSDQEETVRNIILATQAVEPVEE